MYGMGCVQGKPGRKIQGNKKYNQQGGSNQYSYNCEFCQNMTFNEFILHNGGRPHQSRRRARGFRRRPKLPAEFRREAKEYYARQPSYEDLCRDYEEDNFDTICYQMEQLILDKFETPIGRSSTPTRDCFHCSHSHLYTCCMYAHDTVEDAIDYAYFKRGFDTSRNDKQYIRKIPEAYAGQTTPRGFPGFSYVNPEQLVPRPQIYSPPVPVVWVRQYMWPFIRHAYLEDEDPQTHVGVQNCYYYHYDYNYYRYHEPSVTTKIRQNRAPITQQPRNTQQHNFGEPYSSVSSLTNHHERNYFY